MNVTSYFCELLRSSWMHGLAINAVLPVAACRFFDYMKLLMRVGSGRLPLEEIKGNRIKGRYEYIVPGGQHHLPAARQRCTLVAA